MVTPDAERRPESFPPSVFQIPFLTLRGPVTALSTAQFEGADDTYFTRHSVSPIMVLISSPLLVSFHFHAKVLASLIPC